MDCCSQSQGHSEGSKCQCLSRRYLLNQKIFCHQTRCCDASSWAGVSCKKFASFKVKMTVKVHMIKMWQFWTADPSATKPGLIIHHHKPESESVLWRNWISVFKVEATARFQNVSKCLSGWYLLNHWTFCYQTLYGAASSRAALSSEKIGLVSSKSRSQWRII